MRVGIERRRLNQSTNSGEIEKIYVTSGNKEQDVHLLTFFGQTFGRMRGLSKRCNM